MTPTELRAALKARGLTQLDFCREVEPMDAGFEDATAPAASPIGVDAAG